MRFPRPPRQPVYTIEAITYRDNPIWPISATGRPPDDSQIAPALGVSAEVLALLRSAGLPITTAWLLVDTACHWMIVTLPKVWRERLPAVTTTGIVHRIGELMSANRVGHMCPVTYVFDDDIDPSNISDVLWALGTRIHPNLRQEHWQVPILPWYQCYTEEERHGGRGPDRHPRRVTRRPRRRRSAPRHLRQPLPRRTPRTRPRRRVESDTGICALSWHRGYKHAGHGLDVVRQRFPARLEDLAKPRGLAVDVGDQQFNAGRRVRAP